MAKFHRALTLALTTVCCQPVPEPPPDPGADSRVELVLEPDAPLDAAPLVLRFRLKLRDRPAEPPEDVLVVRGELSDYHIGRIQKRDLPKTLLERIVPALAWMEVKDMVVAPAVPLLAGETYSIASPGLGRAGFIVTATEGQRPLFSRVWPPKDGGTGSERVLYCGTEPAPATSDALVLDPGAHAVNVQSQDTCLWLTNPEPMAEGTRLVPPPELSGVALDPAPLEHVAHAPPPDAECTAGETELGPGCATVEDDRVIVRSRPEPSLWQLQSGTISALEPVVADGRFVVRGFAPASEVVLDVGVFDLAGRERRTSVAIQTTEPRLRLVIDEVLANAAGPEPQQEWVELVNDGSGAVDTTGFVLEDLGGATELPGAIIQPAERVLIVREDFVEDDGLDVPVPPDARLLRVERLGQNGLGNSGEPLALRAADGSVVSRFPAVAASKAGRSIARKRPWDLDDDPTAFALHAEPGASPGAMNTTE